MISAHTSNGKAKAQVSIDEPATTDFEINEDNVFNMFAPPNTIADSQRHELVPIFPQGKGDNVSMYNADEAATYEFILPTNIIHNDSTFYTIEGKIVLESDNNTMIEAYDPATVATHCTLQNNINMLWQNITIKHNNTEAEILSYPGYASMLGELTKTKEESETDGPNNFTYLKLGETFDTAGGTKYTFDVDKVSDNKTTYNESFEKRCKITGGKIFTASGKIPLGFFTSRKGVATKVHNTSVIFMKNTADKILENRSGTTPIRYKFYMTKFILWIKPIKPAIHIVSQITQAVNENKKQCIAYQKCTYTPFVIDVDSNTFSRDQQHSSKPSLVVIGVRNTVNKNLLAWNNKNVSSVSLKLGDLPIPSVQVRVNDWTKDAYRNYHMYLQATGQFGNAPPITYDEFITNYCLWWFDTSGSVSGELEFDKSNTKTSFTIEAASGETFPAGSVADVFYCHDKLYTIEGPNDMVKIVY